MITGLLTVFLFYMSLFISNLYYKAGSYSPLRVLFVVPCITYVVFAFLVRDSKYRREFLQINSIALAFILMLIPSAVKCWNTEYKYPVAVYVLIAATVVTAFAVVLRGAAFPEVRSLIRDNYVKILIVSAAVIASGIFLYTQDAYFMWDFHLMFDVVDTREPYHLLMMNKLDLDSHICYSYVAVCVMLKELFRSAIMGMRVCGVILYLLGLFGFWKCLCLFEKKRNMPVKVLCTIMFAVSPYMLGMISYCYTDYALGCLFPLLAYVVLTRKYLWSVTVSLFYVFAKEPAILIYTFLIVGIYIVEALEKRKIILNLRRYIVYLIPCVLWMITYFFVGHWAGTGSVGISGDYIVGKLMTTYIINFNYLLLIPAAAAIIIACVKHREDLKYVIPIVSSLIAFSLMTFVFITVNHPRYIDSIIAQINLLAGLCILNYIPRVKVKYGFTIVLSCLMLVSCFFTVDPLMLLVFEQCDMGHVTLITTNRYLSDGMVYNYRYQSIAAAMDKAWAGTPVGEDAVIYLPALYDNTWFSGLMGLHNPMNGQSEFVTYEYWNTREETRMTGRSDPDAVPVQVHYITEEYEFDPVQTNYFFYYNGAGEDIASKIFSEYRYETDEFECNGVIVHRVKFWV